MKMNGKRWCCAILLLLCVAVVVGAAVAVFVISDRAPKNPFADWSYEDIDYITPGSTRAERYSDADAEEILSLLRQVTLYEKYRGQVLDDGMGEAYLIVVLEDRTKTVIGYTYARISIDGVWYVADRESCRAFAQACFRLWIERNQH